MMSREIKFRAWDKQEKRMITNGCLGAGSGSQLIVIEWDGGLTLCNAFGLPDGTNPTFDLPVTERFELMQYTGLKDKNGKEIYEGDMVVQEHNIGIGKYAQTIGVVTYLCPCFKSVAFGDWVGTHVEINSNAEVIGNIYENPELFKTT